ncbi:MULTISPECIES: BMP family ABC transporter substrate-binding protein [unclassified Sedimentibacter]|uniref:BMP family ABC transporter substrate-binding protein n=1 Tax=unclassified Sedimentibacter TaxID=2649220 RepID=UPI0027E0529F|nr:BMP family ABC transporter substrate-binding protein [Sedimentibacter sp. MB35-C1]WMJ77163.1 BMP family ABC transporter substrate-binding protein [Sedimentibacter sp. MB35-C1]
MKKVFSLLLVVAMIFSLTACGTSSETPEGNGEQYKAALLLNGTLGDKSFFDSANSGLQKLKDELGADKFDFKVEQMGATPADETKWEPTLLEYCDSGEYDVIIVGTYQMLDPLVKASEQFPDQKFIFFDETYDFEANVNNNNIYNVLYKQNEVSFLIGAAAAMMTTSDEIENVDPATKNIGFLGGMENPIINDFLLGYIQGAKEVEPDIKVAIGYVGNFYDSAAGKDIALTQYQSGGVDVGYNVAGAAGLGQIEAAIDANKYAFGVDSDQAALMPEKAHVIPTSALKNVGNSIYRAIMLDLDGKLEFGKAESLGFAEGGVEIVKDEHYEEMLPESIRTKIDELEQKITSGEIVVDTAIGKSTEEIQAVKDSVK